MLLLLGLCHIFKIDCPCGCCCCRHRRFHRNVSIHTWLYSEVRDVAYFSFIAYGFYQIFMWMYFNNFDRAFSDKLDGTTSEMSLTF